MSKYASGKYAWGLCDRTGFRYPLKDLVYEYKNGKRTGMRVGRDMVDPDHPQNFIGKVRTWDAQSLRDPRPDPLTDRGTFGFSPVNTTLTPIQISVGTVTVVTTTPVVGDWLDGDWSANGDWDGIVSTGDDWNDPDWDNGDWS